MKKKLNCVLLIDDSESDNFLHRKVIEKSGVADKVEVAESGQEGLDFLQSISDGKYPQPELIFLDINMPGMNGWEFLDAYASLGEAQKGGVVVVMLTTSMNPKDRQKAETLGLINDFYRKPLTRDGLMAIVSDYFPENKV